jgi:hypothetical protein
MKTQALVEIKNQKHLNPSPPIIQKKINNQNKNWMKDWMEQADNYKNNPEALSLIANNVEGFLHYADIVEGKYV